MAIYELEGIRPQLPEEGDYYVAPTAAVIGKVMLASKVSVWFGATVRGDNEEISIGERSNLQDCCVLHTDPGFPMTIGCDVTVGHNAVLHGCTIANSVLIGMGATVLNGAKIGEGSIIGARALVAEGVEIAPRSLVVGVPGRVVRMLTDDQAAQMARYAEAYTSKIRRYTRGLHRLD